MTNMVPSSTGPTIVINMRLLACFSFGWSAWSMWPKTPEWWGFGLLSLCLALASFAALIGAGKLMLQVQKKREQAVREYLALGSQPKSSEVASPDALRQAGMR